MSTQKRDSGTDRRCKPEPTPPESRGLGNLLAWEQQWHQAFQHLREGWPERTYGAPVIERKEPSNPKEPEQLTIRVEVRRTRAWPPEPGLWDALIRARTPEAVRRVCKRWEKWLHPGSGLRVYPQRLAKHAREFLKIMRNDRYPRSPRPSSDEKRLDFFARGMAGVDVGISPLTAIDRLRKMKHTRTCECWRCYWKRMKEFERFMSKVLSEEEQ